MQEINDTMTEEEHSFDSDFDAGELDDFDGFDDTDKDVILADTRTIMAVKKTEEEAKAFIEQMKADHPDFSFSYEEIYPLEEDKFEVTFDMEKIVLSDDDNTIH